MKHFFTVSWAAVVGALFGLISSLTFDILGNVISDEIEPSDDPIIMKSLDDIHEQLKILNEKINKH